MNSLVDRIVAAFATDSPPPERIVVHECLECEGVARDFAGKRWTELSLQDIEAHYDSIPLLSPEAFAYYLPAYLMVAAKDRDRFGEWVLYSLGPSTGDWAAERRAACAYSGEQLQVVIEVAEMIARADTDHFDRFLRRARAYWNPSTAR